MQYIEDEKIQLGEVEDTCLEDSEYTDCEFYKCHFINTKMRNCIFKNCAFNNCVFSRVSFKFTNMLNCELNESMLLGINWQDVKRKGFGMPIQAVKNSIFKYNSFSELNMSKFDFSSATFLESSFENCNLSEANFHGVNLGATRFTQNNLKKTDFREAKNYLINVHDNQLKGAKFSFPEVVDLLKVLEIVIEY